MSPPDDGRRVFVITPGRTGSSLLAAILSDAGADFGPVGADAWDPARGAFEHPLAGRVVARFDHMNALGHREPHGPLAAARWRAVRHRAKAGLRRVLGEARCLKGHLETVVHWAARLGYRPTVIVSYRPFNEVLQTLGHMHPQPPHAHAADYDTTLRDALSLASTYGGCAVDYHEVMDPAETAWADALAAALDLDRDAVLAARANRVRHDTAPEGSAPTPFPSCRTTYDTLRRYKGLHLPPARATRRAFGD